MGQKNESDSYLRLLTFFGGDLKDSLFFFFMCVCVLVKLLNYIHLMILIDWIRQLKNAYHLCHLKSAILILLITFQRDAHFLSLITIG